MEPDSEEIVTQFTERMGLIFENEGLPGIAGKIYGLLLAKNRAHCQGELAERLQVSAGSISTNTKLLEQLGMVVRSRRPGSRRLYFEMAENYFSGPLEGTRDRIVKAKEMVEETERKLFPGGEPNSLSGLAKNYEKFIDGYEKIIESLRQGKD